MCKYSPAGRAHYAWSGRSHALLQLRKGRPVVGNKNSFATNGSAQPKASARNEVAAPRVAGPSGRTVIEIALRKLCISFVLKGRDFIPAESPIIAARL